MGQPSDRNKEYMMEMWGTDELITDYGSLARKLQSKNKKRMLREIVEDDITPKKHDFEYQNEVHKKNSNPNYNDWSHNIDHTW